MLFLYHPLLITKQLFDNSNTKDTGCILHNTKSLGNDAIKGIFRRKFYAIFSYMFELNSKNVNESFNATSEEYQRIKASIQNESSNGRSTLHEVPYFLCICDILLKGLRTRTVPLTFFTFHQKKWLFEDNLIKV